MNSVSPLPATADQKKQRRAPALQQAVAQLEIELLSFRQPPARPTLVVLSGLPGSGKSFLARRLQPRLAATIIETDRVRRILFAHPAYTGPENAWVYSVCHALMERLLGDGQAIIFDATNLEERHRRLIYDIAERTGARLVLVRTVAPLEVIDQRMIGRAEGRDPDDRSDADMSVYYKLRQTETPIRRPHLVIDTTQDSEQSLQRILRQCQM